MLIVGERINTSRKQIKAAVAGRDREAILSEARNQVRAGANFIDVHAASSQRSRESDDLAWIIDILQDGLPESRVCIDTTDPETLAEALKKVHQDPLINSITGERSCFEAMAPLLQGRGCSVVALCIDDRGIPNSAEQVLENAATLVSGLEKLGVRRERIYVDPVIQAVSTNTRAALVALEAMETIRQKLEGVHLICGLSNVSFGLPRRHLLNRTFLALAMKAGLDAAIVDPLDRKLMSTLQAAAVLLSQDPYCQAYTRAHRAHRLEE